MPTFKLTPSLCLAALGALALTQVHADEHQQAAAPVTYGEVVQVHSPAQIMSVQKLPNFVGISGRTAGAKHLSMNLPVIPPGGPGGPAPPRGL